MTAKEKINAQMQMLPTSELLKVFWTCDAKDDSASQMIAGFALKHLLDRKAVFFDENDEVVAA